MRTRAAVQSITRRCRMVALAVTALLAASPAGAETLVTSLSNHRVLINSNYTGTSIAESPPARRHAAG